MGGFPCDLTSALQYSMLENLPSNYFLHTVQQTGRQTHGMQKDLSWNIHSQPT